MTTRQGFMWLALAAVITLLAGGGYTVAQQVVRHDADHPQVEMARDAAAKLSAGAPPSSVLPSTAVDLRSSPDPYLIVVNDSGAIVASSATLDGERVIPPAGVFDYVRAHGEDTISWQPDAGVRSAIVVDAYRGGFVVAGRSLESTENLESSLLLWTFLGWAAAMIVIGTIAFTRRRRW